MKIEPARELPGAIAILGVGAMGSLFGACLASHADVVLFGRWPEQLEALRRKGLKLIRPDGQERHVPIRATNRLEEVGSADIVLVLVKSPQTQQAARQAARVLRPNGLAVTLQNGLGNLEELTRVLGPEKVALGVTTQGARMLEPGVVLQAGEGPTSLARPPGAPKAVEALAELLSRAGFETHLVQDAEEMLWRKLVVNIGLNPLTALLGVCNGVVIHDAQARSVLEAVVAEAVGVARAKGLPLSVDEAIERTLQVAEATSSNRSSMLQDVQRGTATEIEAILGMAVRTGRWLGAPMPVGETLYRLVGALETGDLASVEQGLEGLGLERPHQLEQSRENRP